MQQNKLKFIFLNQKLILCATEESKQSARENLQVHRTHLLSFGINIHQNPENRSDYDSSQPEMFS
jgi:hypothetical protein